MTMIPRLAANCPGALGPKLPLQIHRLKSGVGHNSILLVPKIPNKRVKYLHVKGLGIKCNLSAGRNSHLLSSNDEFPEEPFWLNLMKESFWGLQALFLFLVEQPGQLRYIEWPSFHTTLKTAALTLVLVALLIVALCSVDSALCYLLAFLLRRAV